MKATEDQWRFETRGDDAYGWATVVTTRLEGQRTWRRWGSWDDMTCDGSEAGAIAAVKASLLRADKALATRSSRTTVMTRAEILASPDLDRDPVAPTRASPTRGAT